MCLRLLSTWASRCLRAKPDRLSYFQTKANFIQFDLCRRIHQETGTNIGKKGRNPWVKIHSKPEREWKLLVTFPATIFRRKPLIGSLFAIYFRFLPYAEWPRQIEGWYFHRNTHGSQYGKSFVMRNFSLIIFHIRHFRDDIKPLPLIKIIRWYFVASSPFMELLVSSVATCNTRSHVRSTLCPDFQFYPARLFLFQTQYDMIEKADRKYFISWLGTKGNTSIIISGVHLIPMGYGTEE